MDNRQAIWFNTVDLTEFSNKVEVMFELGHFISSSYPDFSEQTKRNVLNDCRHQSCVLFQEATLSLQKYSNLKQDAAFGPLTVKSVNNRFCPLSDRQAAGRESKWSFNDLTVWHDMQDLSDFDEVEFYMQACNEWAKVTPLTFKFWQDETDRKPNLFAHARRIDGPGKVLAWQQLPPPNASRNVQLEGRYDTSEAWAVSWQLLSTMIHEIGHGLGLVHSNNPGDIMYHTINGTRVPASGDIRAIRNLYGIAAPPEPPPVDPPPTSGVELVSRTLLGVTKDGRDLIVEYKLEDQ